MSALNAMDDDFDADEAPRPRKRKSAPPKIVRPKSSSGRRPSRTRQRARQEEPEVPRLGLVAGWLVDLRARTKRSAAFSSAVAGFFGVVALAGVIAGGHVPKAMADCQATVYEFLAAGGLRVEHIKVVGTALMPKAEVDEAIGLIEGQSSIFEADPHAIQQRLEAKPWVARAEVRRVWPNRIEVLIVERRPMALWQSDGKVQVIDRSGTPISAHDPQRFGNLVLVVGQGAAAQAAGLLDMLDKHPSLKPHVKAAVFVGQRRWNLRLDNRVEVRLPEEGADEALTYLVRLDSEQQVLARQIEAIDLRFPDRLIVKLPPDSPLNPQKPAAEGRDT